MAQGVPGSFLRPRIILTFRHYKGGRSSAKRTGRFYPRRNPRYSLSEAESTSGHMVLSGEPRKKSPVTPPWIDPGTVRLVSQCLNHYATPGPIVLHVLVTNNNKREKNLSRNYTFYSNLTTITGTLHKTDIRFSSYLVQLFLEWEIFQTKQHIKSKHTFCVMWLFPENRAI